MANIKDLVDETVEAGLIASLLYNPELCYHSEDLTERHFSDPVNSVMYYAITQVVNKGIFKIDAINIPNESDNMVCQYNDSIMNLYDEDYVYEGVVN